MALRVNRTWRVVGWTVVALLVLAIGYLIVSGTSTGPLRDAEVGSVAVAPEASPQLGAPEYAGQDTYSYRADLKAGETASDEGAGSGGAAATEPMIVRTAALDLQVDAVDAALNKLRAAAAKQSASVEQLSVSGGEGAPRPLDSAKSDYPTPANAMVVLRVPADKLESLTRDIAALGTVVSQSSSSDDVTQQYVDIAARLKNLKAEEARLRAFFGKATKVSEMLAIERELSRVRGEIEAMQAQVDYLKRQVAKATLTVTMSEPGPVIQPTGANWGFTDAIRRGIQAAAALLTTLITILIAVAPLVLAATLVWLLVRWIGGRRKPSPTSSDVESFDAGDKTADDS